MGVLMQAFYWDCPNDQSQSWWDYLKTKMEGLSNQGFSAIWLPPANKGYPSISCRFMPIWSLTTIAELITKKLTQLMEKHGGQNSILQAENSNVTGLVFTQTIMKRGIRKLLAICQICAIGILIFTVN